MTVNSNFFYCISMIIYFLLLIVAYLQISVPFDYYDIVVGKKITISGVIFLLLILFFVLGIYIFRKDITKILFSIICFLFLLPAGVGYLFNPFISDVQIISYILFCYITLFFFKLYEGIKQPKKVFLSFNVRFLALLVSIGFLIIFYDRMHLENVFKSVYDVRVNTDYSGTRLEGYFFAFVVKFLLPFLAVIYLRRKNFIFFLFVLALAISSFTIGNVKSVLFGLVISCLFAYSDTYKQGLRDLYIFFIALVTLAILEDFFLETFILNDFFVRRVILFPPVIATYFYDYFANNPLGFSSLAGGGSLIPEGYSVSMFIGEFHMPYFTDPSSGVIVQGFVTFGLVGVCLWSMLWTALLAPLIIFNVPPYFTGLIIYLFYISNTAFLSTLLFTHGVLLGIMLVTIVKSERFNG